MDKICKKCGVKKDISDFYHKSEKRQTETNKHQSVCKACQKKIAKENNKKYYAKHKHIISEKHKTYYDEKKVDIRKKQRAYYDENKDYIKQKYKQSYNEVKKNILKYQKTKKGRIAYLKARIKNAKKEETKNKLKKEIKKINLDNLN